MFGRNIKCNSCGFGGKIEAKNTLEKFNSSKIFKFEGKTSDGYFVFICPSCANKVIKSPYSFIFTATVKAICVFVIIELIIGYFKKWTALDFLGFPLCLALVYSVCYFFVLVGLKVYGIGGENVSDNMKSSQKTFATAKQRGYGKIVSAALIVILAIMLVVMG